MSDRDLFEQEPPDRREVARRRIAELRELLRRAREEGSE